jgi:hypothetical protein
MQKMLFGFVVLVFLFSACQEETYPLVPEKVRQVIFFSDVNYIEFVEAINQFRKPEDSLKLQALYFLIGNMPNNGYRTYLLQDAFGRYVDYNIDDFSGYESIVVFRDSLEKAVGPLKFVRHYKAADQYLVRAEEMVQHVNHSFLVWNQTYPEGKYDFDSFCKWILPPRVNQTKWYAWDSILSSCHVMKNMSLQHQNIFEDANYLINQFRDSFDYNPLYVENPTDLEWERLRKTKQGRLEDVLSLMVMALRYQGIAATLDFIPVPLESIDTAFWWIVVKAPSGSQQIFHPYASQLKIPTHFPKVFRRDYRSYNDPLPDKKAYKSLKYHHLADGKYKDVTSEYVNTFTWRVAKSNVARVHDFERVFLHVRYNHQWIPVDFSFYQDSLAFFQVAEGYPYALLDSAGNMLYHFSRWQLDE